jgi:hypothetical protein
MHEAPTNDGDRGLALLALFIAAMLLDVTGVWVLSALGGWWLLTLAMAIHLLMACLVLGAVTGVVGDQGGSAEARDPRPVRSERPRRNAAPAP